MHNVYIYNVNACVHVCVTYIFTVHTVLLVATKDKVLGKCRHALLGLTTRLRQEEVQVIGRILLEPENVVAVQRVLLGINVAVKVAAHDSVEDRLQGGGLSVS